MVEVHSGEAALVQPTMKNKPKPPKLSVETAPDGSTVSWDPLMNKSTLCLTEEMWRALDIVCGGTGQEQVIPATYIKVLGIIAEHRAPFGSATLDGDWRKDFLLAVKERAVLDLTSPS